MAAISERDVVRIDPKAKSIWLKDETRLGFAQARKAGIDVEELMSSASFRLVTGFGVYLRILN